MMRNNSPGARDIFAGSGRDPFLVVSRSDVTAFAMAIKFMVDPEFPAHPFTQEIDGATQVNAARGDPEDPRRKKLFPMANGQGRAAIKPRAGEYNKRGKQGDGD